MRIKYITGLRHTGSLCPSSNSLAHAMFNAASTYFDHYEEILFAGIGSGVIAKLFSRLKKRVVFVDIDPDFCQAFRSVLGADHEVVCSDLRDYLKNRNHSGGNRLIVSCLPMRGAFRVDLLMNVLREQVAEGATVVFFSYFPYTLRTHHECQSDRPGILLSRRGAVLRNFPPAFVYSLGQTPSSLHSCG